VLQERSVSTFRTQDSFAMNMAAVQSSNSHILKDRYLHSRRHSSEKTKPNNGATRRHTRRKPQSCLGVFRVLQNNKPHSTKTHTCMHSATLSGHSALDGDECDVRDAKRRTLFGSTSTEIVDFFFFLPFFQPLLVYKCNQTSAHSVPTQCI
jgi:hypothetical protein